MEDSPGVKVSYTLGHVQSYPHPHRPGQLLLLPLDNLLQVASVDVLCESIKNSFMYTGTFKPENVWVFEFVHELDFLEHIWPVCHHFIHF